MRRQFPIRPRAPGSNLNIAITIPRAVVVPPPEDCPECPNVDCGVTIDNAPPDGLGSTSFDFQMEASGGTGPYTWSATGAPAGWTIDSTGYIGCAESLFETYTVTITVVDSGSPPCEASQEFTVIISE